ncbi:hypothetical protein BZA70DRAFT_265245 [Myxozyma melibiosi]|uniref:Secreted protein n=1 Tax=Myxozyma melibiosi TaxID=54550 RepID=A0ABR1FFH0_9ASCO
MRLLAVLVLLLMGCCCCCCCWCVSYVYYARDELFPHHHATYQIHTMLYIIDLLARYSLSSQLCSCKRTQTTSNHLVQLSHCVRDASVICLQDQRTTINILSLSASALRVQPSPVARMITHCHSLHPHPHPRSAKQPDLLRNE